MQGWQGTVLRIDLDSGTASPEPLGTDIAARCIGGRGLASRYILDEMDASVDALDPASIVVVATGPLAGTSAPAASRYQVAGKSPLTGMLSFLNAGGHFGAELKRAGYDALIIRGRATRPVYIWIENDSVAIRPADGIWGKGVGDVERALRKETQEGACVVSIGPAGERLVKIATIANGGLWSAGGAGLGAVLGSKNVKAIAVKGSKPVRVADFAEFNRATAKAMDRIASDRFTSIRLPAYGTGALVHLANDREVLPTANFRRGTFAAAAKISGEAVADDLLSKSFACFGCPIACGRYTKVGDGSLKGKGPEFEHLWALGSNCLIDDLSAVATAAYLCQELGLDPVEAGCAIATAMELRERGAISNKDVGAELRFGDGELVVKLLKDIGSQEGFGRALGEGGHSLAEKAGQPDAFVGTRGQALAAYHPRRNEALALHYATSFSADDHLAVGLRVMDRPEPSALKTIQDEIAAVTSAGICPLVSSVLRSDEVAQLLTEAAGTTYGPGDLLKAGESMWNADAAFARKAGVPLSALLPARLSQPRLEEPLPKMGVAIGPLLEAYHKMRGWSGGGDR